MTTYYFTEDVRHVLGAAREEAAHFNHEYVGTEHLLLGLLRENGGVADQIVSRRSIDKQVLRQRLENIMKRGSVQGRATDLPYTSRAKRVLELATESARDLHDDHLGTEHLLLGMLTEATGIASQVLTDAGLTLDVSLRELAAIRSDAKKAK